MLYSTNQNSHRFLHIPEKQRIDETIELLESKSDINEKLLNHLQATLTNLRRIRSNIVEATQSLSPKKNSRVTDSELNSDTNSTIDSPGMSKTYSSGKFMPLTSIQTKIYKDDIRNGMLLVEIQKGLFLHPEVIQTNGLRHPFINMIINQNNSSVKVNDGEDKDFSTFICKDPIKPIWDQIFEHDFHEVLVKSWNINISLNYHQISQPERFVTIGEPQTFSMSALLDQKVHIKQLEFKDNITKGILAKVIVRFQFIHDLKEVYKKLLYEVDSRILRLKRLQTAFLEVLNQQNHSCYASFDEHMQTPNELFRVSDTGSFSDAPEQSFYMN